MGTPTKWGQEIPVNTTTQSTQDQPKIEALANGRFVAAWRDISATGGDTSGQAVRAQMFNADGSKFGGEFVVNTVTANDQSEPDIIALSDGRYLITWKAFYAAGTGPLDTSQSAIAAQLFDANGGRVGGEFLVNTTTFAAQNTPAGAAFANGRFVLSWIDFSATGDTAPGGIRAQLFEANGSKFGAEFLVNSTTVGNQVYPSVAVLADGNFVAAWTDGSHVAPDTSSFAIWARIFNSVGIPYGPDFVVNTTTQVSSFPPTSSPSRAAALSWPGRISVRPAPIRRATRCVPRCSIPMAVAPGPSSSSTRRRRTTNSWGSLLPCPTVASSRRGWKWSAGTAW